MAKGQVAGAALLAGSLLLAGCKEESPVADETFANTALSSQSLPAMFRDIQKLSITGNAEERGRAHGEALAAEIHLTWNFYERCFNLEEEKLKALSQVFESAVREHLPEYATEIDAIASAAKIEAWKVYAINARSELLNDAYKRSECSLLAFEESRILGQTWDWAQEPGQLAVVLDTTLENGKRFLTLTEPGMLAKIGMNTNGLGVSLNFLYLEHEASGIPIHLLLRRLLEEPDLASAERTLARLPRDTAGAITLLDASGQSRSYELADKEVFIIEDADRRLVRTNHYLSPDQIPAVTEREPESVARQDFLERFTDELTRPDLESMKLALLDSSDSEYPVCIPMRTDPVLGKLGTIAVVIMDLKSSEFHIARPQESDTKFQVHRFD